MLLKTLRIVLSLALLFAMLYLGKLAAYLIPIGISDSIWGLLILFTCLVLGVVKVEWITPSARPLTRYMTLFFIPICAEILEHTEDLVQHFNALVLATFFSTLISLVAIGVFAQWVFHRHSHHK